MHKEGLGAHSAALLLGALCAESIRGQSRTRISWEGGVTCWPEDVQCLLRNYAISIHISAAARHLRAMQNLWVKSECEYATILNRTGSRCSNVHNNNVIVKIFIDALFPATSLERSHYWKIHQSLSYLNVKNICLRRLARYAYVTRNTPQQSRTCLWHNRSPSACHYPLTLIRLEGEILAIENFRHRWVQTSVLLTPTEH